MADLLTSLFLIISSSKRASQNFKNETECDELDLTLAIDNFVVHEIVYHAQVWGRWQSPKPKLSRHQCPG
jgi:hypothetical protein